MFSFWFFTALLVLRYLKQKCHQLWEKRALQVCAWVDAAAYLSWLASRTYWVVTEHPLPLVFSLSMKFQLAIVAYAYNPNAWEAEAGRLRFKDLKSAWATEWEPVSKTKTLDQQQSQTQHCYGKRFLLLFIYCSGGWIQCLGRPSWLFDCIQSLQGQSFAGTVTNWYRASPECTRQTLDIMPSQFFVLEHLGSYLRPFLSFFLISLCIIFSVCACMPMWKYLSKDLDSQVVVIHLA